MTFRATRSTAALALGVLCFAPIARAQAPAIDPTFGSNGITSLKPLGSAPFVTDALVMPDDRILVCGELNSAGAMFVARFLANGTLDASFGTSGVATVGFGNTLTGPVAIARQPNDGRIVLAGAYLAAGVFTTALARFDSTGALDTGGFGTLGRVTQALGTAGDTQDLLIQPDGRILVAGSIRTSGTTIFMGLRRYLSTGAIDPSFGVNGTVNRGPGVTNLCNAITLLPDGRIVAVGTTDLGAGAGAEFLTFRFKSNGSPDSTFATFGRAITAVSVLPNFARAVQVLADGRVLVAGHIGTPAITSFTSHAFAVLRLTTNGTPDPTFGSNGIAATPTIGILTGNTFLSDAVLESGGRLLLGGQGTNLGSSDDMAMARMDSLGGTDLSFSSSGAYYLDASNGGRDFIVRLLRQSSGRLVAIAEIGTSLYVNGPDLALVGYRDDQGVAAVAPMSPTIVAMTLASGNPTTGPVSFSLQLAAPTRGSLAIYDLAGRRIALVASGAMPAGTSVVRWDGRSDRGDRAPAGVYLARFEARLNSGEAARIERKLVRIR